MAELARAEDLNQTLLDLLHRSARGDQVAFHRLYELTSGKLYAVALRLLRRNDLADDVMQEAYVKIWHNAREYISDRGSVITWMVSILRYRAIDRLRKLKRDLATEDADDYQNLIVDEGMGPLQYINAATDAKLLHGCLEELIDKQKHSIALAFYDGLTHEQLSKHLNYVLLH